LRSATSFLSSKTKSNKMPNRSLKCSLSRWSVGWRHGHLEALCAGGALPKLLEGLGKDMVSMNCIRGS
jgi:hypothetical protein